MRDLLNRIGDGDDKAAKELYRAYAGYLYAFLHHQLPSEADVDEVVQDTLLAVCRRPDAYKATASFKTYITTIAKNKAADWWRKHHPDGAPQIVQLDADEHGDIPDAAWNDWSLPDRIDANERARALEVCRGKLPVRQREAIFWSAYEEESVEQVAERLGIPVGTVKSQLFHARKNLLACLKRRLGGDFHG